MKWKHHELDLMPNTRPTRQKVLFVCFSIFVILSINFCAYHSNIWYCRSKENPRKVCLVDNSAERLLVIERWRWAFRNEIPCRLLFDENENAQKAGITSSDVERMMLPFVPRSPKRLFALARETFCDLKLNFRDKLSELFSFFRRRFFS